MDLLKNITSTSQPQKQEPPKEEGLFDKLQSAVSGQQPPKKEEPVGFLDKLHGAVGGGRESEKKEDALDKAIDYVQEKFLGQGPQDNENAIEQAKDEAISDFIRGQFKSVTGKDIPVKDK